MTRSTRPRVVSTDLTWSIRIGTWVGDSETRQIDDHRVWGTGNREFSARVGEDVESRRAAPPSAAVSFTTAGAG